MFFIQVARGRPGGRLQFSGEGSKMAWLASAFSSIRKQCTRYLGHHITQSRDGADQHRHLSYLNVLAVISKGTRAVKLCRTKSYGSGAEFTKYLTIYRKIIVTLS